MTSSLGNRTECEKLVDVLAKHQTILDVSLPIRLSTNSQLFLFFKGIGFIVYLSNDLNGG